jgi:hypothetical protein
VSETLAKPEPIPQAAATRGSAEWLLPHIAALTVAMALGGAASVWPSAVAVGIVFGAIALAAALWATAKAGFRGDGRAFRRRAFLVLVIAAAPGVFNAANFTGWLGRLWLFMPAYKAQVTASLEPPGQRLVLFHWAYYQIFDDLYLAYDDSDRLRGPQADQPAQMQATIVETIHRWDAAHPHGPRIVNPKWETTPLWKHWYVVEAHG